jgi:hypothetical protein
MYENTGEFSISAQCAAFDVSRSGYYAWRHRHRERLDLLVAEAFEARKGRSGAVGITLDLDEQGHRYNRKTVAASMKRQGLVAKAGKKYKATTDSEHSLPVAPNRLKQDFTADAPNQKWVCDITYCAPSSWRWHRDARRDLSMTGIHMDKARRQDGPVSAFCCERARAEAAVTCRTLAG